MYWTIDFLDLRSDLDKITNEESIGPPASQSFIPHPILYKWIYFLNSKPPFELDALFLPLSRVWVFVAL